MSPNEPVDSWDKLGEDLGRWADEVFEKDRGIKGILDHLKEEIDEILQDPRDGLEWADAFHLLLDAARLSGFSPSTILRLCREKLNINLTREWKKDGHIFRHVEPGAGSSGTPTNDPV